MIRWYEQEPSAALVTATTEASRNAFEAFAAMDAPELPADATDATQVALARWQAPRFANAPTSDPHMALGIIEELGETFDAPEFDDALDGLGDVCVYASQLATANRLAIGPVLDLARVLQTQLTGVQPIGAAGFLAHLVLKHSQKIRGLADIGRYRRGLVACLALAVAKATDDIEIGHALDAPVNVREVFRIVAGEVMARTGDMLPRADTHAELMEASKP